MGHYTFESCSHGWCLTQTYPQPQGHEEPAHLWLTVKVKDYHYIQSTRRANFDLVESVEVSQCFPGPCSKKSPGAPFLVEWHVYTRS